MRTENLLWEILYDFPMAIGAVRNGMSEDMLASLPKRQN